jgi:hypothetical protein
MTPVADDVGSIRHAMEKERGTLAAFRDDVRDPPADCVHRHAWFEGYDEGRDIKRRAAEVVYGTASANNAPELLSCAEDALYA